LLRELGKETGDSAVLLDGKDLLIEGYAHFSILCLVAQGPAHTIALTATHSEGLHAADRHY